MSKVTQHVFSARGWWQTSETQLSWPSVPRGHPWMDGTGSAAGVNWEQGTQSGGHGMLCWLGIPHGTEYAFSACKEERDISAVPTMTQIHPSLNSSGFHQEIPGFPLRSCSYLGNMGSGGSGEGFCSGTEHAGEHFLPSRAAADLQDRQQQHQWSHHEGAPSVGSRRAGTFPLGCTYSAKHRRGESGKGKKDIDCTILPTGPRCFAGPGRGFYSYPKPRAAEKAS